LTIGKKENIEQLRALEKEIHKIHKKQSFSQIQLGNYENIELELVA
jgi:hypothetical protein